MIRRLTALTLALAVLTGCGATAGPDEAAAPTHAAATQVPELTKEDADRIKREQDEAAAIAEDIQRKQAEQEAAAAQAEAEAQAAELARLAQEKQAANAPLDLTTDQGLCQADSELTNLELNDALAPLLGYPADRDARTPDQDDAIRAHKNAAFSRACPARMS